MEFANVLKSLALDRWYKLLVLLGSTGTIGSIFIPVRVFDNFSVFFLSSGVFLIGLGEWASHRRERFERETDRGSTVSGWEMRRFNNIPGNFMSIFGMFLVGYGVYSAILA